jgi:hypothetical protein
MEPIERSVKLKEQIKLNSISFIKEIDKRFKIDAIT